MIFCPNPSLGNFDYAEKVIRFIKDPCFFVYDVMIKAFAKRSSFRSAVELFRRLREEGLCPYNFTYPFVLRPLVAWERFGKVKRCLMKYLREAGFVGTWNVTISRYVRCRRFGEALDMFRRMSCESNEKPDEATAGEFVMGIQYNRFNEAVALLTSCAPLGALDQGEWIHGDKFFGLQSIYGLQGMARHAKESSCCRKWCRLA
ncbi:hypothetical protein ACFX1Q_031530 [Malus domestica]